MVSLAKTLKLCGSCTSRQYSMVLMCAGIRTRIAVAASSLLQSIFPRQRSQEAHLKMFPMHSHLREMDG